jgi:Cu/Ag efflux pump CusA
VIALAVRQSLGLARRVQVTQEGSGRVAAADAVRRAVREAAPRVVTVALVTAAAFLPAAVLGNAPGLEVLHPFAVTVLGGLVTSTVVVLYLVPALFLTLQAERSPSPTGPAVADDGRQADHQIRSEEEARR